MEPPSKKSRPSPESHITADALVRSEKIINKLMEAVSSFDSSGPASISTESLCTFLELKTLQQLVLENLETSRAAINDQLKHRDREEMQLQNLKYQKTLNDHSINISAELDKTQLAQLCCDEMGIQVPETSDDLANAIVKFLGADPKEPENRSKISAKLNQEVKTRTTLQATLKVTQQQAAALEKNLAVKRKHLRELPMKLQEMEQASTPLQKFCRSYLHTSKKVGTQRQNMLELARLLPKPLYTLYYHLQSCLDRMGSFGGTDSADSLPALEIKNESSTIVLKIQIPNVADNSSTPSFGMVRFAKIHFDYNQEWDLIAAYASQDFGMRDLINELFPGDTGEWPLNDDQESSNVRKRPYNWCNYLGGLHVIPGDKKASEMHISTYVVVKAIARRVKSLATLNALLSTLSHIPNPIPIHPSMQDGFSINGSMNCAKLLSWSEEESPDHSRTFVASMAYESSKISIRISIDPRRYPAIPPVITVSQGSSDTNIGSANEIGKRVELFDDRLSKIQRKVNEDIDQFVLKTSEASYDWILTHQLAAIARDLAT
eukprot:scaffold1184_cov132-Cylindrotheca_fusiformis.AAC.45